MNWFSPHWFYLKTLNSFIWANGYLLWLIGLIPVLFFLKWVFSPHKPQMFVLSGDAISESQSILVKLRFLVPLFFMLGIFCLVLATARPQLPVAGAESFTEGVDIAIALDISDSMLDKDLKPNRLEAAKAIGEQFIDGRVNDRIALVAFAGETMTLSPLTSDYTTLKDYLASLNTGLIRTSGTAIGMALASCVNKLRDVEGNSKIAIIISDGDNTTGEISPETALELAKTFGVRVYTIAIGTSHSDNPVVEKTLRTMAGSNGGRYYMAADNEALPKIFADIDRMEKNRAQTTKEVEMADYYYQYLYWAMLFFMISTFLRLTFLGNLLED